MPTVKCSSCTTYESITFCGETGLPLCAECATACDVCSVPVDRKRIQLTSRKRKLCTKCMAERNARRRAQREERKDESRARKQAAHEEAAPMSFEALTEGQPSPPEPSSFEALSGDSQAQPASASFEALGGSSRAPVGTPDGLLAEAGDAPQQGETGAGPMKTHGLEGVPTDRSTRLELPPIDDERPILTRSGYNPPSKVAYLMAFIFFGVSGLVFYSRSDALQALMWPFETPEFQFNEGLMTPIQDTNRLRDTSNISQLDLFSQGPIFLITWSILIVYLGGSAYIIITTSQSVVRTYFSKRRMRKAEKKNQGDPFSSLG